MKIWTFLEAKTKILNDLSLQDEVFVNYDEMSGYCNDALTEAEGEIMLCSQVNQSEYLLTSGFIPTVQGQEIYSLPFNIYANKIRNLDYVNGNVIYAIKQYRRHNKFISQEFTEYSGQSDDYRYTLLNDYPGQAQIRIRPAARETTIMPPQVGAFTPVKISYLRNCARIPMIGEFCNHELLDPSQVNTGTGVITVNSGTSNYGVVQQGRVGCFPGSIAYITGDAVKVTAPYGTVPGGLVSGATYYVIAVTPTTIKLATTSANAFANVSITLTSPGTVSFILRVAATAAIVEATLLDIPEFTPYIIAHMKCPVAKKEGGALLAQAEAERDRLKNLMIAALAQVAPDDEADTLQMDYSSYDEMS